jgi:hypothetical protein
LKVYPLAFIIVVWANRVQQCTLHSLRVWAACIFSILNISNNHGVSPETSSQCLGIKDGGGDRVFKEKGI